MTKIQQDFKLRLWNIEGEYFIDNFYIEVDEDGIDIYEGYLDIDEGRNITDSVELRITFGTMEGE